MHSFAWLTIFPQIVRRFRAVHPAVELEIETSGGRSGLAARGMDIGLTLGELIEPDERAVKLGAPVSWIVVASPDYAAAHGLPRYPRDLTDHRCIHLSPGEFLSLGSRARWQAA